MNSGRPSSFPAPGWLRFSWLWMGLGCGAAALCGWYPGILLARLFSPQLSAAYVRLLQWSQWSFGGALLAGGFAVHMLWPWCQRLPRPKRPIALNPLALVILAGICGAGLVQWLLFGNIPHITDASSYWFQSRVFASGHLQAVAPPCPLAFFQHNVIISPDGAWHTKYFPGHALWLVWPLRGIAMPVAFGLFLLGSHRVMRRYFGSATALAATLLLAFSPLMWLLTASFMSHMTLMMWLAVAWALWLSALAGPADARRLWKSAGAGFSAGMAFLTRPQDAALGAVLMVAATWPAFWQNRGTRAWLGAALLAGALPTLGFLLFWNHGLYGHWLASGYHLESTRSLSQTLIIHDRIGLSNGFTIRRAIQQCIWPLLHLNQALLGWPAAFLLLIPGVLMPAVRRGNLVLLAGAAWLYLPYFFFHYYGLELEARYMSTAAPLLVLVIARTLVAGHRQAVSAGWRHCFWAWLLAFAIYAAAYYWPRYIWPRYSGAYEETTPAIHRAALQAPLEKPALVLLPDFGYGYTSGFIFNDPQLRAPILYARDLEKSLACLRAAFPERHLYRYVPPTDKPGPGRFLPVPPDEAVRP